MRQVGILAAAGLWALEHHLDRLPEDHERARRLAAAVDGIPGFEVPVPDTNIVMIDVEAGDTDATEVADRLTERGVFVLPAGSTRLRAVTHLDVTDEGIDRAIEGFRALWA
jgi:threonine aldolase